MSYKVYEEWLNILCEEMDLEDYLEKRCEEMMYKKLKRMIPSLNAMHVQKFQPTLRKIEFLREKNLSNCETQYQDWQRNRKFRAIDKTLVELSNHVLGGTDIGLTDDGFHAEKMCDEFESASSVEKRKTLHVVDYLFKDFVADFTELC